MTVRYLGGALTAIMLTGGLFTVDLVRAQSTATATATAPDVDTATTAEVDTTTTASTTTADAVSAPAWTRDASLLPPEESAVITIAGCLQRGGKNGDKYVLARPKLGPIASVPEGTCSATIDDRAIGLEHERKLGMNELLFGHVIEVNGRLERETSSNPDNMRELHVRSFRVVPVVPPRVASAPETPLRFEPEPIAPAPAAPIEEKPVATAGVIQLPNTASSLPAIGLLGMLTMVGGLALHLYRSRERA